MNLPYLTADQPGVGGAIKEEPGDFLVEEIPLYDASGTGEHVLFLIEKTGFTTYEALKRISRALDIPTREFGYAGLKDRHAITRQFLSVRGVSPQQVNSVEIEGIKVLTASWHQRKLRTGHLKGNRFSIKLSHVPSGSALAVRSILDVLEKRGLPNYYGRQRFGARKNTHILGRCLLFSKWNELLSYFLGHPGGETSPDLAAAREAFDNGEWPEALRLYPRPFTLERKVLECLIKTGKARSAVRAISHRLKRLYLSAFQSFLFNAVLTARINSFDELWEGDIAYIHQTGGVFMVTAPEIEARRLEAWEISPSGPIFGEKTLMAVGEPGAIESDVMSREKVVLDHFKTSPGGVRLPGARRPLRVKLSDVVLNEEPDGLRLDFSLPSGSYATCVLREIRKVPGEDFIPETFSV